MKNSFSVPLLAALLGALPFIYMPFCWWLVGCAYAPLIWLACKNNLTFLNATVWYTLFIFFHATILLRSISPDERSLPLIFCFFCMSLVIGVHAGLWAFTLNKVLTFCTPFLVKICVTGMALVPFFLFVDRWIFWFCSTGQGYSLAHPLLPLMPHYICARLVGYMGEFVSLALLIFCNALVTTIFLYPKTFYKISILVSPLFFASLLLCFFCLPPKKPLPFWLTTIAYAHTPFPSKQADKSADKNEGNSYEQSVQIALAIREALRKKPHAKKTEYKW